MTTLDITTDPTFLALCAAIDAGDDTVLPILADRLEEMGDPRADGLRRTVRYLPFPEREPAAPGMNWFWEQSYGISFTPSHYKVPVAVGRELGTSDWVPRVYYPTRSAAFLALAAALAESAHA